MVYERICLVFSVGCDGDIRLSLHSDLTRW